VSEPDHVTPDEQSKLTEDERPAEDLDVPEGQSTEVAGGKLVLGGNEGGGQF
jgi:hypothetical protein